MLTYIAYLILGSIMAVKLGSWYLVGWTIIVAIDWFFTIIMYITGHRVKVEKSKGNTWDWSSLREKRVE